MFPHLEMIIENVIVQLDRITGLYFLIIPILSYLITKSGMGTGKEKKTLSENIPWQLPEENAIFSTHKSKKSPIPAKEGSFIFSLLLSHKLTVNSSCGKLLIKSKLYFCNLLSLIVFLLCFLGSHFVEDSFIFLRLKKREQDSSLV